MTLHKPYLIVAFVLLVTEILIALFVKDTFIRPIGGDFLVIILLYTTVRGFTSFKLYETLIGVLLFSYVLETLQYFNIVEMLGLEKINIARVVIGTYFAWEDILAYTAGALFVLIVETRFNPKLSK
ncbi:DUF2809 domain-containing protein [Runella sp.]|uniref:ribosomal maturation YjgA family protein n=1 Tax=Runella sp. TaxID=1960881 RepID=UPI003D11D061